jgi:hypothetical protein
MSLRPVTASRSCTTSARLFIVGETLQLSYLWNAESS